MAVALRGSTSWAASHTSWPSGTQQGDLAVMVVVGDPQPIPGWVTHAEIKAGYVPLSIPGFRVYAPPRSWAAIMTRTVGSGNPDVSLPTWTLTEGRIVTFSGASGARARHVGGDDSAEVGPLRTDPQGGLLVLAASLKAYSLALSGVTVLSGDGEGGPLDLARPDTGQDARVGYALGDGPHTASVVQRALAVELIPTETPDPPSLYTPQPGSQVSATSDLTLEWQHEPNATGGYQSQCRVQFRVVGSGTWSWIDSDGTVETSETTLTQADQELTLNAGALSAGSQYEWQVATREAVDGEWSSYSASATFTAVTPPTVVVSAPTTVTDDLTPTVQWTPTTPQGSQTAYRVTIDETGYDSGVVRSSTAEHTVPVQDWTNGGTYTAGVRVQQTGGSWSTEGTRQFTLSWTPPSTPTVSVQATSTGMQVTVAGSDSGSLVEVQRTYESVTFTEVTQSPVESDGSDIVVVDVTAEYGRSVVYRARASTLLDGQYLSSSWTNATAATSVDQNAYIVDSRDWTTYARVTLRQATSRTRVRQSVVSYGLGDSRPMVDHAPYAGQTGQWVVMTETVADMEALAALLGVDDGVTAPPWPLLFRWPPNTGGEAEPTLDVAVVGDVVWQPVGHPGSPYVDVTLTWVEQ